MEKLLIFDFDGVIVDSIDVYEGTVTRCLEEIGQPIINNREDFLALFDDNFYESLVSRGVNLDAFLEASVEILAGVNYAEIKPYDDLLPVLRRLKADNILIIISSSDTEIINGIMNLSNLMGCFQDVLGSDVNLSKQEKILLALDKFNIAKESTYYIGDTTGDIKEAKAVGIRTLAVTWGWHSREKLVAVHPDYVIDRPEELLKIYVPAKAGSLRHKVMLFFALCLCAFATLCLSQGFCPNK